METVAFLWLETDRFCSTLSSLQVAAQTSRHAREHCGHGMCLTLPFKRVLDNSPSQQHFNYESRVLSRYGTVSLAGTWICARDGIYIPELALIKGASLAMPFATAASFGPPTVESSKVNARLPNHKSDCIARECFFSETCCHSAWVDHWNAQPPPTAHQGF